MSSIPHLEKPLLEAGRTNQAPGHGMANGPRDRSPEWLFVGSPRGKRMIEWNKILVQYGSVISCKIKIVDQLMSVFFTWLVLWNIFYFSIQLGIMIPIDEVIFFSEG